MQEGVEKAIQALLELENDPVDLENYCQIIATPAQERDAVAQEQLDVQLDAFFQNHPEYDALADIEVEDARIEEQFNRLEEKCGGANKDTSP